MVLISFYCRLQQISQVISIQDSVVHLTLSLRFVGINCLTQSILIH